MVDLVTLSGRPLTIVDDPPMVEILKMAARTNIKLFNSDNLRDDVLIVAEQVKKIISKEVRGRHISMMIDTATRYGKSILGINVQYIHDDEIKLRTIGMVRLYESHTGLYIAQCVKGVLDKYGIKLDQIYSFTADNAANMGKARTELNKLFGITPDPNDCGQILPSSSINDGINDDNFDEVIFNSIMEEDDDCFIETLSHSDHDVTRTVIETIRDELSVEYVENIEIEGMPCAAHTLQLSIVDTLQEFETETGLLQKSRTVSAKLRTPNIMTIINGRNLPVPVLQNLTRWNSCLDMVKNLFF